MKKIRTASKIIALCIFLSFLFFSCATKKKTLESTIFFKQNYKCDSIYAPTYNFILEDDSSIYSPMEKEPFDFKLQIIEDCVKIDGLKYYYVLGGLNTDTLGLINITDDTYLYKKNKDSNKSVVLFSFNKELNDSWVIKDGGYFSDYEVILNDIKYNEALKDAIYIFSYNFIGDKFPNGYYFENFKVSKKYGILSFSFNNGVECDCFKK